MLLSIQMVWTEAQARPSREPGLWDPLPLWWWQGGHRLIWKQQRYRGQRQGLPMKGHAAASEAEAGGGELAGLVQGCAGTN